jgi:hypothetical protein
MKRRAPSLHRRPGRPRKFGRPSKLVALTLPIDVIRGLRQIDNDVANAVVRLYELAPMWARESTADVEMVSMAAGLLLIVVNTTVIRTLPGVDIIPLDGNRGFFALAPGRGVSDLELAVIDRLGDASDIVGVRERQALEQLRRQLREWHNDSSLQFHSRAIIVVETTAGASGKQTGHQPVDRPPDVELAPFADGRSLIVVNSTVIRSLPGVDIIPLGRARAFLALVPGRVVGDLELAVLDQLRKADALERRALDQLRRQLKMWRQNSALEFHARAIIVVAPLAAARDARPPRQAVAARQSTRRSPRRFARTATDLRSLELVVGPRPARGRITRPC